MCNTNKVFFHDKTFIMQILKNVFHWGFFLMFFIFLRHFFFYLLNLVFYFLFVSSIINKKYFVSASRKGTDSGKILELCCERI